MVMKMNPFIYSNDNKRYHTFNYYLKQKYQRKVAKVALNANFTCPNRDGAISQGGCIYCSDAASGDFGGNPKESLMLQFEKGKALMQNKWPGCGFIAYFQAGTNTYGSLDTLKTCFEPFVNHPDVLGLAIATRPDCLSDEIIAYLSSINQRCDLTIELGLQTIHEKTAKLINRGHDLACFVDAVNRLRKENINVCVHIIDGLPFETREEMMATAKFISTLDIQFLKIHLLFILDNTPLYHLYQTHPFPLLERESFIQLVVDQLEIQKPELVIERLTGDGDPKHLFYPLWSIKKVTILNDIDKCFVSRKTYQGHFYQQKQERVPIKSANKDERNVF